ncbi:MAG: septation protein SpoVG family protein [Clostridia bacterium]|nr:septation protein SpoVG family protein [Clostridia bacterium]
MNISVKQMTLTNDNENFTRAFATLCIDEVFNIEGVTVKKSKEDKLYVQLPQKAYKDKETNEKKYKDACYPTTKEIRTELNNIVLETYYQKLEERENIKEDSQKKNKKTVKEKTKQEEIEQENEESR